MIRIGARRSVLSRIQTKSVESALKRLGLDTEVRYFSSQGDKNRVTPLHRFGKIGVFTSHLEEKLLEGEIDVAVHSYKDLPTILPGKTETFPVLKREDPRDLLIIHKEAISNVAEFNDGELKHWKPLIQLKHGTRIGTSSLRRQSQILSQYPQVSLVDIRGNIETRIRRVKENVIDGLMMAKAAFTRIGVNLPEEIIAIELPLEYFPTAPGQGAIAIQVRKQEPVMDQLRRLIDSSSKKETDLEKKVMSRLGNGCIEPIGITVQNSTNRATIYTTYVPINWKAYDTPPLRRIVLSSPTFDELEFLAEQIRTEEPQIQTPGKTPQTFNGKTILVPNREKAEYATFLGKLGATPILVDVLTFKMYPDENYVPSVLEILDQVDWIAITSPRTIFAAKKIVEASSYAKRIACIGPSTARTLWRNDIPVHLIASRGTGKSLAHGLISYSPKPKGVLHLGAKKVHGTFHKLLQEASIPIFHVPVYERMDLQSKDLKKQAFQQGFSNFDYILVFSPSQVDAILSSLQIPQNQKWIAIGPTTGQHLQKRGMNYVWCLENRTPQALLEVKIK